MCPFHPLSLKGDQVKSSREDAEFLIKNHALPSERIRAIETGGCPHAAIREDISANLGALESLQAEFGCQMLFVESGGDNLAANYSRELADYIIYVIDVSVGHLVSRSSFGPLDHRRREAIRYLGKAALGYRSQTCLSSTKWVHSLPCRESITPLEPDRPCATCKCIPRRHGARFEEDAWQWSNSVYECERGPGT